MFLMGGVDVSEADDRRSHSEVIRFAKDRMDARKRRAKRMLWFGAAIVTTCIGSVGTWIARLLTSP